MYVVLSKVNRLHIKIDQWLINLSVYGLPALICLLTALLFIYGTPHGVAEGGSAVEFRVLEDAGSNLQPSEARERLHDLPQTAQSSSRLSEAPFWLSFEIAPSKEGRRQVYEFPSRHAVSLSCWNAETLTLLGRADYRSREGALEQIKSGFAFRTTNVDQTANVICKSQFVGPARISIVKWSPEGIAASEQEFQRNSGLMNGGLIVLALFMLITALINRQKTYLLFALWLTVNLRMAALSAGWDQSWLGHDIPPDLLGRIRPLTLAAYYTATITLFRVLFQNELEKVGHLYLLKLAQWTCLPILLLSLVLPYHTFLPLIWIASGVGTAFLVFYLVRILALTRSTVAIWYSASIAVTLLASMYEVISAALGIKGLIGSVNSVSAALSSSLLASLAVAEQMRQQHLRWLDAKAQMDDTFQAMPIGMFSLDLNGRFLSANPALMNMLSPDVLESGTDDWERYFSEGAWKKLQALVRDPEGGSIEIKGVRKPRLGAKRFLVNAALSRGKIEGSLQDVTAKSRAEEDLQFLANNDPLTRVLNRRGVESSFRDALALLASGSHFSVAYLDLDRFKLINDIFGHAAGDDVLQQVCERMSQLLTKGMSVGRVGGDEFLILMPDTRVHLASLICRSIIDAVSAQPYLVGEKAFNVRCSIGLVDVSLGTTGFKEVLSTADRACREAKAGNGDGMVVYETNAAALKEHAAELQLVERLSTTSATHGLFLEMQPIMSLVSPYASLNFEVLLRMRDADGRLIPTERLISAGESSGSMTLIDRWVLANTLEWLKGNGEKLQNIGFVCMNLSGASLNDEKFMDDVCLMLTKNADVAQRLCLEITESVALHDLSNTQNFVDRVRQLGAKVALDDFGAGYTSFSYLKNISADLLKIDGSFIVNMNQHPANIAIVEAIVNLASNLGMKVIAEWAEDVATVQTLAAIGVDYVQGFAISRSQAPERFLTAASSASFIQDEQVARFVSLVGATPDQVKQVDLFDTSRPKNLH